MKLIRIAALLALTVVAPTAFAAYSLSPYQTFNTGSWADAVAIGDINGDGRNDVVLTTTSYFDEANDSKVFVFFQKPDGTLGAPQKYTHPGANRTGLALANLDGDRRMEIIVGHGAGITILDWGRVFRGKEAMQSRLHLAQELGPVTADDVVVIDVNRDGALDVVAQSWSNGANIYFGDGHGGISRQATLPTPAQGYNDLESGDFNGDGHDDVVVLSGQGTTHAYVYYNDGTDDLSAPLDINPNPGSYVIIGALGGGDFNADGRDDLVVMRDRSNLALFSQDASGGLQPPTIVPSTSDPNAIIGHDLDLDGRDDLIVQHGGGPLGIYLQGAGGLTAEVVAPGPYATWFNTQGLAAGDINGDACPDIVTANNQYGLVVHLGSGCNTIADLAPSLGLTSTIVALRLDNFGAAAAVAPEATVALSVLTGTLSIGTLPAGCSVKSQASRTAQVLCTEATLASGTSRTLLLPITITGNDPRNVLSASASANTTSIELRLDNNLVHGLLRSPSSGIAAPTLSKRTRPEAGRLRTTLEPKSTHRPRR